MKRSLHRELSTSSIRWSNVGSAPIMIPSGTVIEVKQKLLDEVTSLRMELDRMRKGKPKIYLTKEVTVKGPKGATNLNLPDFVKIDLDSSHAEVSVRTPAQKYQRAMWGTSRSLVANAVTGVNEGHLCIVKLVGTGFRAQLEENKISLRVGRCVPQSVLVPADIHVEIPVPHRIIIEGCDKQKVKLLAAEIRKFRKPEPYKGKGIFVDDETIKLKQKKIK